MIENDIIQISDHFHEPGMQFVKKIKFMNNVKSFALNKNENFKIQLIRSVQKK